MRTCAVLNINCVRHSWTDGSAKSLSLLLNASHQTPRPDRNFTHHVSVTVIDGCLDKTWQDVALKTISKHRELQPTLLNFYGEEQFSADPDEPAHETLKTLMKIRRERCGKQNLKRHG